MLVLSEKLRYAGVREVADSRSLHEMFTSMKTLAARGVSYVLVPRVASAVALPAVAVC